MVSWILFLIFLFILAAYGWQLLLIRARWNDIPVYSVPSGYQPQIRVSVLLPARNEAENIRMCLESLAAQQYPAALLEILLIDDHSSDDTVRLAKQLSPGSLKIHHLPDDRQGKKAALEWGAEHATGELLLSTDADCTFDPTWVLTMASFFESERPVMIGGAVMLAPADNPFTRFQALDFTGMMGLTAVGMETGKIRLCNGANLGYSRKAFIEVNGFKDIDALPSGDDVLMLGKMEDTFPGKVRFLKSHSALVYSSPASGLQAFLRQRLRWAGKTTRDPHMPTLVLSALTFVTAISIPLSLFLFSVLSIFPFLVLFVGKSFFDYLYLYDMSGFFNRGRLMRDFFMAECLHICYWITIGLGSLLIRRGHWKGREIALK